MDEVRMDTGGGGGREKVRSDMAMRSTDHEPCDFQHVDQGSSLGCRLELCGDSHPPRNGWIQVKLGF